MLRGGKHEPIVAAAEAATKLSEARREFELQAAEHVRAKKAIDDFIAETDRDLASKRERPARRERQVNL